MDMTVTSRHYERIVMDDIVHKENVCPTVTPETMAKTYDYIQTIPALLNGLCAHAHIVTLGTRWHDGDAYGKMLKSRDHQDVRKLVIRPYDENGESNWPELFPVEKLEKMRSRMGPYHWACLMMQDPLPPDVSARFRIEWLHDAPVDDDGNVLIPEGGYLAITVDPALSKDWRADRTAIGLTSVPPGGGLYLLARAVGRWTPHGIAEQVIAMYESWRARGHSPEWVGIETDVGGLAVYHVIYRVCQERGIVIPLRQLHSQLRAKEVRVGRLQAYVEACGLYLGPGMGDVKQEILRYPVGEHDDILDMLALRADNLQQPHDPRHVLQRVDGKYTGRDVFREFGIEGRKSSLFRIA
jgi:predicted phage terminase large subunit-like protein